MAIVINGSGTVTGLAVGGLPDGTVDAGTLATDSVVTGKIADGTIANADIADLAASKLTGALPAISGASLTGLTSAQMPTGSVLQVQSTVYSTNTSTTSTSWVNSGHNVTITPRSSSSKILLTLSNGGPGMTGAGAWMKITFYRGGTNIAPATATGLAATVVNASYTYSVASLALIDSPSTTSATTYHVYIKVNAGTGWYQWSDRGNLVLTATEIQG